jgi:hypothetical protein
VFVEGAWGAAAAGPAGVPTSSVSPHSEAASLRLRPDAVFALGSPAFIILWFIAFLRWVVL